MTAPAITVLFATCNGEAVVGKTLEAFRSVLDPGVPWDIVVIDNGSTDATPRIIGECLGALPLTVLHCPKPGKNAALNIGINSCRGELIVIVDDDVLPDQDFLRAWSRYLLAQKEHALLGGRIIPRFAEGVPAWLEADTRHHALMFSLRDLPEGEIEAGDIYGCNMAVRRAIFDRGFRFDEDIGPNRANPTYRMGSEVEFLRRVARSGEKSWFARGPKVDHMVRPSQWSEDAWANRGYRCGLGRAYLMIREQRTMAPPPVTLRQKVAARLPFDSVRLPALSAIRLRQGFDDELRAAGRK